MALNSNVKATYRENLNKSSKINNPNLRIIKCDQRILQEFENLKSDLENIEIQIIINYVFLFRVENEA